LSFYLPFAQLIPNESGLLERIRRAGTLRVPVLKKMLEEAVLPIKGTAIDLLPFVLMFMLLAAGAVLTLRLKRRQPLRRAVQLFSALAFIAGVHPCMCMVRDVVLGAATISISTLEAFERLMVFSVVAAFCLVFGRVFCGYVCPLGLLQELSTTYFRWARTHVAAAVAGLALVSVAIAGLVLGDILGLVTGLLFIAPVLAVLVVYALVPRRDQAFTWARWGLVVALLLYTASYFFLLRPGTFGFIDTVAIWWVIALLIFAMFVVGDPKLDARLKPVKFLSAALLILIIAFGVYTNGPVCVFVESEVVLGTVLSATAVIVLSGVLSSAWCRYVCPEGAILGLLARQSLWKITKTEPKCTKCRSCEPVCPVECIKTGEPDETTCLLCGKCLEACPEGALGVGRDT